MKGRSLRPPLISSLTATQLVFRSLRLFRLGEGLCDTPLEPRHFLADSSWQREGIVLSEVPHQGESLALELCSLQVKKYFLEVPCEQ